MGEGGLWEKKFDVNTKTFLLGLVKCPSQNPSISFPDKNLAPKCLGVERYLYIWH